MPSPAQTRVIDPILTTVVQGYKHPEHIGAALFPEVPVPASGGQVLEFGKESFRLYNTSRAPGAKFKRLQFGYLGKPYALRNHGLEAFVPREHQRDASRVPGIDLATRAINTVMRSNSLILEKERADLARDATQYSANHQVTLSGTAQWNDYANSDPLGDIQAAREAVRSTVGVYPNVMEVPAAVMDKLRYHPQITDKIKYTQRGVVTAELLQTLLDIPRVAVGKAIAFDDAGTAIDVWGKDVILAYVPSQASGMEEPSYGYTYTMEGHPAVEQPYWDDGAKGWAYGISHERVPVISGISSGFLIRNAVA